MTWETHQLIAMVNLAICLAIGWACICRLNSNISRRFRLARARYALLLAGAMSSGLQPLMFGTWSSIADVIFNSAVLAGLVLNVVRWYAPEKQEAS
ncbi:hypothetical protein [Comamonas sp. 26]|uniref:hypothetical protein n=1 Tax=Comamonas sp. 26 TaxID=2035201 RepID=UPI000C179E31|nr:hypothetical protein [Comamonas sp. 26]PIG09930.1 hypothetical protein CLU84_2895 [Comamonas sp. 26]